MTVDFKLPELGENINSGDVVNVLVHEGDVIVGNDGVLELETDKAVVEIPCPLAGKITKIHVAKGDVVKVGQVLLSIEPEDASEVVTEAKQHASNGNSQPTVAATAVPNAESAPLPAGPESRRLARELGVDLSRIQGSGRNGRITVEDVRAAAAEKSSPAPLESENVPQETATEPPPQSGEWTNDAYGPVRYERMSKIRRTIAEQMVKSASVIPHVTNFDDADVTVLEELRKSIPPARLGEEVKLTAMSFALKAVALALRQHSLLNAGLGENGDAIVFKQYISIGVAVDTPRGLVVPVIRNIDHMHVLQIAKELSLLTVRARLADFAVNDLRGGTFTVSNLGAVGGRYSTPIINHPQAAVLLLGRSRWVLSRRDGQITDRLMLPLSLSFDHRIVDGAEAARFLNDVIAYLQSPGQLMLPE